MIRQAIQKIIVCQWQWCRDFSDYADDNKEALEYLGMDDIGGFLWLFVGYFLTDRFIYCISGAAGKSGGFAGRWSGGPYGFRDGSGTIKTIIGD